MLFAVGYIVFWPTVSEYSFSFSWKLYIFGLDLIVSSHKLSIGNDRFIFLGFDKTIHSGLYLIDYFRNSISDGHIVVGPNLNVYSNFCTAGQ